SVTMVSPVDVPALLPVYPEDQRILQHIAANGRVTLEDLREAVGNVSTKRLQRLQRDRHLTVVQGLARPAGKPRFERRVALLRPRAETRAHAEELAAKSARSVAARVLKLLAWKEDVPLSEVRAAGAAPGHLRRLEEEGWLRQFEQRVERSPLAEMV